MMHALAMIAGAQRCDDSQPGENQLSQVHRRRQLTVQEDIVQLTGQPMNISQALCDIQF
ncbi:hypothetical protein JG687_00013279 [Phytophthora cactorum]|uniref:Uncharacterized protein n=2 Tax=Phytophthora TaxID=4783 RepID=A0A329SLV4_9STRA|nr:hypothetical protein Pcac1_g4925 [Phytophthora cactorum]KAG6949590.1 hypothetical protein JG688_00014558 [Phytophthora aleatoria]KAG2802022.1 hypothetical protein PC112_g19798 [Phytophthora cactorum]KAG2802063.1 hypothetical protein PC111_g19266 [Phytophthora cactorum]KAG2858949.1 hypothetical protein PC113_g9378 [Phytophthora cactorum]